VKVAVIDYGVGNLGSIVRSLEELKVTPVLVNRPNDMHFADSYILPGVGSFTDCAKILERDGWNKAILEEVKEAGKPILGICLGMQLLASFGLEGATNKDGKGNKGLGLIPGSVLRLDDLGCQLNVPHVGWNEVKIKNTSNSLFNEIPNNTDFYFVHSYVFIPDNPDHIIATTDYDISVIAAVQNKHIWGTQFHPEKSSRAGFKILQNFINNPTC
tara:strand:+ start:170 stop:814 length:645 start_codon:yes stop_codon:yes gene_type:complete